MCPICLGAAAVAAMAGTGPAGGLAALVAVKVHIKPESEKDCIERSISSDPNLRHHAQASGSCRGRGVATGRQMQRDPVSV